MHKVDSANNVANEFSDGTPPLTPGTSLRAKWHNTVQRELVAVVEGLGGTLDDEVDNQIYTLLVATFGRLEFANTWNDEQIFRNNIFVENGATTTLLYTSATELDVSGPTTVTPSSPAVAITATGNGANAGVSAIGGSGGAPGVMGTGTSNNPGVQGTGHGTAAGGSFVGGATGVGVLATGGASGAVGLTAVGTSGNSGATATGNGAGYGLVATGGASGAGVLASHGTAATGSTRKAALSLGNGDLTMIGVANPNSNVALTNTLTPTNINKANAMVVIASGVMSVAAGFNIASVAKTTFSGSDVLRVTFAQAFASANYVAVPGAQTSSTIYQYASVVNKNAAYVDIMLMSLATAPPSVIDVDNGATNAVIDLVCYGAQ